MSRADETDDNEHAESLFSRYKAELIEGGAFVDVEHARSETFAYIEGYYNRVCRLSALGYLGTEDFERTYYHYQRAQGHKSLDEWAILSSSGCATTSIGAARNS